MGRRLNMLMTTLEAPVQSMVTSSILPPSLVLNPAAAMLVWYNSDNWTGHGHRYCLDSVPQGSMCLVSRVVSLGGPLDF